MTSDSLSDGGCEDVGVLDQAFGRVDLRSAAMKIPAESRAVLQTSSPIVIAIGIDIQADTIEVLHGSNGSRLIVPAGEWEMVAAVLRAFDPQPLRCDEALSPEQLRERAVGLPSTTQSNPAVLPGTTYFAFKAVEREAPEYAEAFLRFLVTEVCGHEWISKSGINAPAESESPEPACDWG